ncbi:unnamed protein product [Boreogadus saida]
MYLAGFAARREWGGVGPPGGFYSPSCSDLDPAAILLEPRGSKVTRRDWDVTAILLEPRGSKVNPERLGCHSHPPGATGFKDRPIILPRTSNFHYLKLPSKVL